MVVGENALSGLVRETLVSMFHLVKHTAGVGYRAPNIKRGNLIEEICAKHLLVTQKYSFSLSLLFNDIIHSFIHLIHSFIVLDTVFQTLCSHESLMAGRLKRR